MEKNISAVLFDLDDTLFDRNAAQGTVLDLIVKRFPHLFDVFEMERVAQAFAESDRLVDEDFNAGAPFDGLRESRSRHFLRLLGIREDYADAITELYLRDCPMVNVPVPGAVPLVKELSLRFQVGVVSNGMADVQYRKLDTIGLRDVFSCIVLSEEIGIRKPDPRIFSHAAYLLHIKPPQCLYVGNSYTHDIVGAKTAGMLACWLNRGPSAPRNDNTKADFVIGSLQELAEILRKRGHA